MAGIGLLGFPLVHGFGGSLSANRRIFGRMFHSLPKTGAWMEKDDSGGSAIRGPTPLSVHLQQADGDLGANHHEQHKTKLDSLHDGYSLLAAIT